MNINLQLSMLSDNSCQYLVGFPVFPIERGYNENIELMCVCAMVAVKI